MMPYIVILLAICMLAAAVGEPGSIGFKEEDTARIQGEWTCVSAVVDGKSLPAQVVAKLKLVMTAERYRTVRGEEEVLFDSTYRLEPGRDPKWIEMVGTEGDVAGKAALGIYALDVDTLNICYTMPGAERPGEFESRAGSGRYLVTWKRKPR
jgi:uncharacterized protein (TIGR03067 family)